MGHRRKCGHEVEASMSRLQCTNPTGRSKYIEEETIVDQKNNNSREDETIISRKKIKLEPTE